MPRQGVLPDWFYDRMAGIGRGRVTPERPKRPDRPDRPNRPDRPDTPRPPEPKPPEPEPPVLEKPNTGIGARIESVAEWHVTNRCPYIYAQAGPCRFGFDCSGLVHYAVRDATGDSISRDSHAQMNLGQHVGVEGRLDLALLNPGDLLFWDTMNGAEYRLGNQASHVGIYAGNGRMHNALNPSQGLATSVISPSSYWGTDQARYLGARRLYS